MDVDPEDAGWAPFQPETLVQGLRCPVCLDYFKQPHTLPCGHSYCISCLRTLAKITRASRARAPLDRLRMRCPSCRKLSSARPILRRRAAINYALKELVNEWFSSPYATGSVDYLILRSIGSQTEKPSDVKPRSTLNLRTSDKNKSNLSVKLRKANNNEINQSVKLRQTDDNEASQSVELREADDKKTKSVQLRQADDEINQAIDGYESEDEEEDHTKTNDISIVQFRRVLFHRIQSKPDVFKDVDSPNISSDLTDVVTNTADDSDDNDNNTTSSGEEDSEVEIVPMLEDLNVVNNNEEPPLQRRRLTLMQVLSYATVLQLLYTECRMVLRGIIASRGRMTLTIFWFMYGGLVVCVSRGFLPWMTIYTIIYFMILYADMAHPDFF